MHLHRFGGSTLSGLAALGRFERMILLGSFSKTLAAALRCGFIVARGDWIESLTDLALAAGHLAQQVTHRLLIDDSYRRYLDALPRGLPERWPERQNISIGLDSRFGPRPESGMFPLAQLSDELDSSQIAIRALDRGLLLAPDNVFCVSQTAGRYLRFNVAQCGD